MNTNVKFNLTVETKVILLIVYVLFLVFVVFYRAPRY